MDAEIRLLLEEEMIESMELSEFAFQYEQTPEERERKRAARLPSQNWGAFVQERLAAKLTILELKTWIQGKVFDMGGIAGVATWPEYRRGGLVSRLLERALADMRQRGQTVSFLHPFDFGFYRKFGWETYAEYKKYEIPTALLPKLPPQPGAVRRIKDDLPLLSGLYEQMARRYNGTLARSEAWWQHRVLPSKKGTVAVCFDAAGEPAGYAIYQVKDRTMTVHELVCLHHGARLQLWRFIADHDSMIDKVTLTAPANDPLPFVLSNPRIGQEIVPYFMARIVDAPAFVAEYPFSTGIECELELTLTDERAPWNAGRFRLKVYEAGAASIEAAAHPVAQIPQLSCDIQTFTCMLMSYQRPALLRDIGRLSADDNALELLERLIPAAQTYLPDFF